jgi:glycerophosphoryl diester phosphodiesterase
MNRFRERYRSKSTRPMILAHRGDSFRAPENTLEAAKLGFEAGADGWELDVRLTKDGVPVLLHDESLLRTTDVARRFEGDPRASSGFLVGEFTLKEIRGLDAGSWFVDESGEPRSAIGFGTLDALASEDRALYASGAIRVPTLAEALEWTIEFDRCVNVEIKPGSGDADALVEAVISQVRASGAVDLVAISSFDLNVVAQVAAQEPEVATGALVAGPLDRPAGELLRILGADALHAPCLGLELPIEGVPVLVYTVNDAGPSGLAVRLAQGGVTGLFTDDPTSMTACFEVIPSSTRTRHRSGTVGHRWADR